METQLNLLFDDRYQLIRLIGRGGFSEVWLAKDTITDLEEVIKIYAPGGGMDNDGVKMFVKELTVVHNLRHQNLLTPRGMGEYKNQPYLILPYCPNGSLTKLVGSCSENDLWQIMKQVAAGLAYLHKQGIVHQDIKPDNILIDENGVYVITDFGISLKAQSTLRKSMRVQASAGTMAYMAPERFSSEPQPRPENDIWSLGAMMFELLTGDVPFVSQLGGLALLNGAQIPLIHADVSDELKQLIISMLSKDLTSRPTAEEIVSVAENRKLSNSGKETRIINNTETTDRGTKIMNQEEKQTNETRVINTPSANDNSSVQNSNTDSDNEKAQNKRMFQKPFSFKGRIRRLEFGITFVLYYVYNMVIPSLIYDPYGGINYVGMVLYFLTMVPMIWLLLAQGCKRCHDKGHSGWFQLIPIYNPILLIFGHGDEKENKYGFPVK
jgi:serine/threonine protein kinase